MVHPAGGERWEIPHEYPFPFDTPDKVISRSDNDILYNIEVEENTFGFKVKRNDNGEIIFNSLELPFFYSDYYLQFSTRIPTS